jgi:Sec-independent protein secretion pathway component TatC
MWSQRNAPCPADPALARACMRARAVSFWVWLAATVLFAIGAFFAFFAADLLLG